MKRDSLNQTRVVTLCSGSTFRRIFCRESVLEAIITGPRVRNCHDDERSQQTKPDAFGHAHRLNASVGGTDGANRPLTRLLFAAQSKLRQTRALECAPDGGQIAGWELTGAAGLSEDESHGEAPHPQHRVQTNLAAAELVGAARYAKLTQNNQPKRRSGKGAST
jgi:hypothetical protein